MGHSIEAETFFYANRKLINGRGDFDISRPGVWFLEVEYKVPAPDELKAKCQHLLFHASLTFSVQEKETKESENPLAEWNGKWHNCYLLSDSPAMQPFYKAVAESAKGYSDDEVKKIFLSMYRTDFSDLQVIDDAVIYYDKEGKPMPRCKYKFAGKETASFSGHKFDWYKFEMVSGHGNSEKYKYVIATMVHSDSEGSFKHFHIRYGNTGFSDLINNQKLMMWWPTFVAEGTTAEAIALEMQGEAAQMVTILPPKQ